MSYLSNTLDNNTIATSSFVGNIIPHAWYKKISTPSGKPDLSSIAILAEIVYWYRPSKAGDGSSKFQGDIWQTSYNHFERKFCITREAVRRIFVKLEQLNLITREFRTIEHRGQKYNNVLFLHLNSKELLHTGKFDEKKISLQPTKIAPPSPTKVGDHICNETKRENIKNRSNESNFVKVFFEAKLSQPEPKDYLTDVADTINPEIKSLSGKSLIEYHPISQTDADLLSVKSGREFNLNFINQLLLKLASKYPDHKFPKREVFLNYLAKALSNEMHQACLVNNSSFKMSHNKTEKNFTDETDKIEKYLSEIENTRATTEENILKKKIAGVFEPQKAYNLLRAYKYGAGEGDLFKMELNKYVDLLDSDKEILMAQVKSVYDKGHGSKIQNLEIVIPPSVCAPEKENWARSKSGRDKSIDPGIASLPQNIWGMVREGLIKEFGVGVDKSWFSKLEPEIDEKARCISLSAPTSFMKDWIQTNYERAIDVITQSMGFKMLGLKC